MAKSVSIYPLVKKKNRSFRNQFPQSIFLLIKKGISSRSATSTLILIPYTAGALKQKLPRRRLKTRRWTEIVFSFEKVESSTYLINRLSYLWSVISVRRITR